MNLLKKLFLLIPLVQRKIVAFVEERYVNYHPFQAASCPVLHFECSNGFCIPQNLICDGINQCGDYSDEVDCLRDTTQLSSRGDLQRFSNSSNFRHHTSNSFEDSCGKAVAGDIFGGHATHHGAYPWMAKLTITFKKQPGMFHCGGALIHRKWILTASHCVTDVELGGEVHEVKVQLGRYDLSNHNERGVEMLARNVLKHPQFEFNNNWNNDFALLELPRHVTLTPYIRLICLPTRLCDEASAASTSVSSVDGCTLVTIAGWGITGARGAAAHIQKVLTVANITILAKDRCNHGYGLHLSKAQICAGDGRPISCRGDSGGPSMCRVNDHMYAVGVISWGNLECGAQRSPSIHARVCSALPWIQSAIKQSP